MSDDGYDYNIHDIDLDAVELFLIKPATPGPWRATSPAADGFPGDYWSVGTPADGYLERFTADVAPHLNAEADAKLAAQSRTLLPALIERTRIAEAALASVRDLLDLWEAEAVDQDDRDTIAAVRNALRGAA